MSRESDAKLDKRARATFEGQINGLTKAIALLVKGMTKEKGSCRMVRLLAV